MEGDPQSQSPVAEPSADAGAASEVSASQGTPSEPSPPRVDMNDVMRQLAGRPSSASKPDAASPPPDGEGQGEASAPGGASKSPDDPDGISRRSAPAEIKRLKDENARLQKAYDEANPPPPDATEEARKAHLATERRYRDLTGHPSNDPVLYQSGPDGVMNADWLDTEKERRRLFPEVTQHFETVLETERQQIRQEAAARDAAFLGGLRQELSSASTLPGLEDADREHLAKTTSWLDHVHIHRAAERRAVEAQYADQMSLLRKENDQLRRDAATRARAPIDGGRPTRGPQRADMNDVMRQIAGVAPRG